MKKPKSPVLSFLKAHQVGLILAGIILLAAAFRLYQLASLPPGLHPDEAANGIDIFRILHNQDWRIIYNTNGPREALFIYLQAIFVAALGNTILALRIAPALCGIGAVVMVYLFAKDWFGRRVALLSAFLLAVNPWVNTVSRDGFRASMVPLVIATVAYFAGRAYRSGKWYYFALAGFFMGLGFYTYTAFAVFSLVPLAGLVYTAIWRRKWLQASWKNLLISAAVLLATLLPLAITIARNPADSSARAGNTSFLNSEVNKGRPVQALLDSTVKTLLQFNIAGDSNNRHNLDGEPLLNTFVGIVMLLGILVAVTRVKRLSYAVLLVMFGVMMLPAILTAEGLPHGLRSIGTAATVFVLAGIGIDYMVAIWYKTFPVNRPARTAGAAVIGLLLLLTAVQGWRQYFVAWAQDPATHSAYYEDMVQIGKFLIAQEGNEPNYLIAGGYEALPVEYLTHSKANYNLLSLTSLRDLPLQNGSVEFVYPAGPEAGQVADILKAKYPAGTLAPHYSSFNDELLFYSYEVK